MWAMVSDLSAAPRATLLISNARYTLYLSVGNFHAFLTYKDEEDLKRVHAAADKIVETAIALEGTCTSLISCKTP